MTMEGFQFAHMEVWSVKGASNLGPETQVSATRKNGQRAWTADEIIAELERLAAASTHVIPGRPGPEILPGAVGSFADLRAAHTSAVSIKEKFPYRLKDGTMSVRERKLRADAPSLYASVVSLPVRTEAALADPQIRAECMEVLQAAMAHERLRVEAIGGSLMCGVVHWDEEHVHIHLLALDPVKGRVDHLHPGRTAKKLFHEAHRTSAEDRVALRKKGNAVYREAMRAWQDDFYDNVFEAAGLLRYGPKRSRMSRKDYTDYKAAVARTTQDRSQIALLRREAEALQAANAAMQETQAEEDARRREVALRQRALEEQQSDIIERQQVVAAEKTRAETARKTAERLKAEAEAYRTAVEIGTEAVFERVIEYRPAKDDQAEGLKFGPNKPATEAERKTLVQRLQPAYAFLTGFAQRVSQFWTRDAAQKRQAADLRQQAQVLRAAEDAAGRRPEPALERLADGLRAAYTEADFPEAWAIDANTSEKAVRARLNGMKNLMLRRCFQATEDAVLLCDDAPELRARFDVGMRVLRHTAAERGFDLETGRHDPGKATVPSEATRHTDQLPEPVDVKIQGRDRQRVRH